MYNRHDMYNNDFAENRRIPRRRTKSICENRKCSIREIRLLFREIVVFQRFIELAGRQDPRGDDLVAGSG